MLLKHGLAGLTHKAAAGGGAITFVDATTSVLALDAGQVETTVSLSLTGLAENDVVVALFSTDLFVDQAATATGTQHLTIKTGQGWTVIDTGAGAAPGYSWMYKKMGVTPDTTISYFPDDIKKGAFICQAFRGVDQTTPLDQTTPTTAVGNSNLIDAPAITTVTNNAWVVAMGALDDDATVTITVPTGYSNLSESSSGATANEEATAMMASKEIATAGAEDPPAFTGSSGGDEWIAGTIALRPA